MAWWCLMLPQEDMDGHGWGVDTLLGSVFGPQEESLLTGRRQDRAAPLGCNKWNVKRSSRRTSLKGANIRRIEKLNDPVLFQRCLEILQLSFRNQLAITTPSCMEPYLWCCRLTSKFSPVRFANKAKNHQVSPWFICAKLPWKVFHLRQKAVFG